jgi:hypothetical protein
MATTPQSETGPAAGGREQREDALDREVERRAEHVAKEESDPLAPAREERERNAAKPR